MSAPLRREPVRLYGSDPSEPVFRLDPLPRRYRTEVGEVYHRVADLSEATLDPIHAADIAEWIVETRHPWRSWIERRLGGCTRAWWQAQAIREHHRREVSAR